MGIREKKLAFQIPTLSSLRERIRGQGVGAVFVRGAIAAFSVNVLGTGIAFVSQLILARLLGASSYGDYIFALTWMNILVLGCKLGLDTASLRFVAEYNGLNEWSLMRGFLMRSSQIVLLASIVVSGVLAGVVWLFRDTIKSELVATFFVVSLTLPVFALLILRGASLRALKHVVKSQVPERILLPLFLLVGCYLTFRAFGGHLNAFAAMFIHFLAILVPLIIVSVLLSRDLPQDIKNIKAQYKTSQWVLTALPILLIAASYKVENQTDIVIVGFFLESSKVGIYAAACKITSLVSFGIISVNVIAAPMISELYAQGRNKELQRLVTIAAKGIFLFTLPVCIILIIFGNYVLALFGPEFFKGYTALVILTVGKLINSLAGSVGFLMILTGYQKEAAKIIGLTAVLNVILNCFMIPLFGIIGAALATAFTTALWNVSMWIFVQKKLRINPSLFSY